MFTGLLIRLAGVGMMLHSRGARGSTAELVINQVLQGMGGGFAATCIQVAAQSQVPHVSEYISFARDVCKRILSGQK